MMPRWIPSQSGSPWGNIPDHGPDQATERLALLQESLERARNEYALRRYDAVEHALGEVIQPIEHLRPSGTQRPAGYQLLLASAFCLKGRLRWRRGDSRGEQAAFTRSVEIFAEHEAEIELHPSNSRLYTDYGIALYRIGRRDEAVQFLGKAGEKGATPPEAFAYLGFAYQKAGKLSLADEVLRKGLKLAPGDKVLLSALAETEQLAKNYSAAIETYCQAAVAAAIAPGQERDVLEPHQLLDRALRLAEKHNLPGQQALRMKTLLLRSEGKHADALQLLDRVLKRNPSHSWAKALKGMILQDQGSHMAAIPLLRQSDLDTPELSWALGTLAEALHDEAMRCRAKGLEAEALQMLAEALDALSRARQLSPDEVSLLVIEAEIRQETDLLAAISLLRRAIELAPGAPELNNSLARLLLRSGDFGAASEALDPVLGQDRSFIPAMITKAEILAASGQQDKAIEWYRRAVRANPRSETAFSRLIDALSETGKCEEAVSECVNRLARFPKDWFALWKHGSLLLDLNQPEQALEALIDANAAKPNNADIIVEIGRAYCRVNRYDNAEKSFDKALRLAGDSPPVLSAKAVYLYEIAEYARAGELLEKCVKLEPQNGFNYGALGWVLYCAGDTPDDRLEWLLRRAVELDPTHLWSKKSLAMLLLRTGRADEAQKILNLVLDDGMAMAIGTDARLLHLLGWCNYLLAQFDAKRYAEALRLLQACTSLGAAGLSEHFDLALVLLGSGRSAAVEEYDAAIKSARSRHRLRRRGALHVALLDLIEAIRFERIPASGRGRNDARKICFRLHRGLAGAGFDRVRSMALERAIYISLDPTLVEEDTLIA
jgi:tetratricopeptide (TPR) repeat protein